MVDEGPHSRPDQKLRISEFEDLGSFVQRHLLPVQSLFQTVTFPGALAIALVVVYALNRVAGCPPIPTRAWLMTVLASTAGALSSVAFALPVRFVIRVSGISNATAINDLLIARINHGGYGEPRSVDSETVFKRVKYRWLSWPGITVGLLVTDSAITVRGTKFPIRQLNKRVSTALGG